MENRVIKFRAWQKTHDGEGQMINDYVTVDKYLHFIGHDLTNDNQGDIVSVMQFTGLTDKNGKEIYEGDVVRVYMRNSISEVYQIVWQQNRMRFGLRGTEDVSDSWAFTPDNDFEVIGNIYEHPNILK